VAHSNFHLFLIVTRTNSSADELCKSDATSIVHKAEMGHSLTLALQIGLIEILHSWGVHPDFVLGHSSGEMAAAYAAGAISAESAMAAALFRGSSSSQSDKKGSMAAVGLGRDVVSPYLIPGVVIACENSQSSVTLSGDSEEVEKVISRLKADWPGAFFRYLRVEQAFHSRKINSDCNTRIRFMGADFNFQIICGHRVGLTKNTSDHTYQITATNQITATI
jgi:acyl transferase domain-containing protein